MKMSIELKDYLVNSGAALVLHGERELVDDDLAQLHDFSEKQRAAISSVVLSNTDITGACFRHLALLPNLKALYANRTRVENDAPLECLPKTMETINLDYTKVGDLCVSKLRLAPSLYSFRLRNTKITCRSADILASMSNLRDYDIEGAAVSEHARQRLLNALVLRKATCYVAFYFLLCRSRLAAAKLMLGFRDVLFARYFRLGGWRQRA